MAGEGEKTDIWEDGKHFCPMPFLHFHLSTRGRAEACCISGISYGDVNSESIDELWNGSKIRDFRLKMLRDAPEKRCRGCYNREAAGQSSMRTETLEKFRHRKSVVQQTDENGILGSGPVYWDIRFSNLCNFKCRTCWHGASSSWFSDAVSLGNAAGPTARIDAIQDEEAFFAALTPHLSDAEEFYFAGGEPLFMPTHYRLLELILQTRNTDVQLRYNTNLSLLKFGKIDLPDLWKQFPNITILASIDGEEKRGEYIRSGMNWQETLINHHILQEKCPQLRFLLAPTLSVFNAHLLPQMHRNWIENRGLPPENFYLNLLERPDFLSAKILPGAQKKTLRELYLNHSDWLLTLGAESSSAVFREIPDFIESADLSAKIPQFRDWIEKLDGLRGDNFREVFPELGFLMA